MQSDQSLTETPQASHPAGQRCQRWVYCHKYGRLKIMRTTVDIPDHLYRRLKTSAAAERTSVKELVLRAVEKQLRAEHGTEHHTVQLPIVKSKRPGHLLLDNEKIYEI